MSSTFLYDNADARKLVQKAITASKNRHNRASEEAHDQIEASWRERALNAEAELTRTQKEVHAQRQQTSKLQGQTRDAEQMVPGESAQAITTENTTLKQHVLQLTQEHRTLQERLEGARSNNRFADRHSADSRSSSSNSNKQGRKGPTFYRDLNVSTTAETIVVILAASRCF